MPSELGAHVKTSGKIWSGKWDSNPRPSAWEAVQALVRLRPFVSVSVYSIRAGDDPQQNMAVGLQGNRDLLKFSNVLKSLLDHCLDVLRCRP